VSAIIVRRLAMNNKACVSKHPSGVYRVGDTRISLDAIVHSYLNGESPEAIAEHFPILTIDDVNGAIAFYLANREEVHEYLKQREVHWEKIKAEIDAQPTLPVVERLRALKAAKQVQP
jgi:uncharacterized protein (DUF433 family)